MKKDSILKSTSLFSLATLLSRILGLVRESCVAALVPSAWQDILWAGLKIPSTFRQLFAEGALSAAFIPMLTRVREREGEEKSKEVAFAIFNALGLTVAGVVIIAIILAPWFVPFILDFPKEAETIPDGYTFSYPDQASNWRIDAGIRTTQIMFPFLFFVALSAWAMGLLNTYRYFFMPAVASAFFNVSLIIGVIIGAFYFEGIDLMWLLGGAVVFGGLLQYAVQLPQIGKVKCMPPRAVSPFHPQVKVFLKMLAPTVFGLAIYQLNALITQTYFASKYGEGGISTMQYAFRLIQFPLGIIGVALATASFPQIAQHLEQQRQDKAVKTLEDVLKYLLLLMIPSAVGLIVLGEDIVGAIFNYGEFRAEGRLMPTYYLLIFYSMGLFSYAAVKVLVRTFQANHDFRTPVVAGAAAMVCNIILCSLFVYLRWPLWSLALAAALASSLNGGLLAIWLKYKMLHFKMLPLIQFALRVLLACVVMALACYGFGKYFPISGATPWGNIMRVMLGVPLGMAAFGGSGWFLFRPELKRLLKLK